MSIDVLERMIQTEHGERLASHIHDLTDSYPVLGSRPGERAVGFDLDKTLIYGQSSLNLPEESQVPLRLVEFFQNKPLTYMTEASNMMLGIMAQHARLIPVTARREDQMARVMLSWKTPHYVCLSGAMVVIDGQEDVAWTEHMRREVGQTSIPLDQVRSILDPFQNEPWFLNRNVFGGLFEVAVLDLPHTPRHFFDHVDERLEGTGFFWSVQGRKLYLTPNRLSKGDAFQYLVSQLGITGDTYGAGDSLMDLDLLRKVDYPFHPLHGEIADQQRAPDNSVQSSSGGVLGGEEIVARVYASVVR